MTNTKKVGLCFVSNILQEHKQNTNILDSLSFNNSPVSIAIKILVQEVKVCGN